MKVTTEPFWASDVQHLFSTMTEFSDLVHCSFKQPHVPESSDLDKDGRWNDPWISGIPASDENITWRFHQTC